MLVALVSLSACFIETYFGFADSLFHTKHYVSDARYREVLVIKVSFGFYQKWNFDQKKYESCIF